MSSNEFLDINESMSSQNGKYKMKFLKNGVMKLFGASTACVNRNRIGNKTTTSLHTINNTAYNVAEKSSSNSNSDETYFNLSLGDCISRCDNNSVCAAVEYKKGNVSSCEKKKRKRNSLVFLLYINFFLAFLAFNSFLAHLLDLIVTKNFNYPV